MRLNRIQQEVIDYNGNGLVFASAGTGKTNTIALKISNIILTQKANPNEILCLTFTNKGCNEISERVLQKVGDNAKFIPIKTFHSYCYSLIKEKNLFDKCNLTDYSIFDEEDAKSVIKKVINDMDLSVPFSKKEFDLYHIISFIKKTAIERHILHEDILSSCESVISCFYSKDKGIFNQRVRKLVYKFSGDITSLYDIETLTEFLRKYQFELETSHAYDFDDLEYYANVAIQNKEFLHVLKQKYKYVFIDEAQDTSYDEYNFVKQFITEAKVFLCGDFFQTIYEWRGSSPNRIIEDYKRNFNAKTFVFNINYRSTKNIANSSFGLLKNMFPTLVEEIYEEDVVSDNGNLGEPIYIKSCVNLVEEAKFINEQIKINQEKNACVLVRTNDYAIKLSQNVDQKKFFLVQDFQYYKRNEVKEIIAFLKLILNPYDTVSLERIAVKYVKGFGDARLGKITSNKAYALGIRIADLLDIKTHRGKGDQYYLLTEKLLANDIVVFDTETTGLDIEKDEIIQIAAIKIDKNGNVIDKFNLYVKNKKPVGDSYYVHKISDEKLAKYGIEKKEALNRLLNFIGNSLVVGHNVTFDLNILNAELEKNGIPSKHFDYYDTYLIARKFITGQLNFKLETLSKNLHLSHESSHDALDDVEATASLLVYLVNNHLNTTKEERMLFLSPYLKLFSDLATILDKYRDELYNISFEIFLKNVVDSLNMRKVYEKSSTAIFNIEHFLKIGKLISFKTNNAYNSLRNMVNIASLSASDFDAIYKEQNLIPIITVHQSKGCEFNDVYIAGMGTDIFPSYVSRINNTIEEEKRLFYVAYTRAKNRLYLLSPQQNVYGYKVEPSILLKYIPTQYIERLYSFSRPSIKIAPSFEELNSGLVESSFNRKSELHLSSVVDVDAAIDEAIEYIDDEDYDSAIEILSDFKNGSNPDVYYYLGVAYYSRNDDTDDIDKAKDYLMKSYNYGKPESIVALGDLYLQYREYDDAFDCYRIAGNRKIVESYNNLGLCYSNGYGTPQNLRLAFIYYQMAAKEGNSEGQFNVGSAYELGSGTPINLRKAFEWYSKAAEQDNVDAIYNIGTFYYDGKYVRQDYDKALEQFKRVIELQPNDADAHNFIGLILYQKHRLNEAIPWIKKAFDLGNEYSSFILGVVYNELGNQIEARKWFVKAKNLGIEESKQYL